MYPKRPWRQHRMFPKSLSHRCVENLKRIRVFKA